MSANVMTKFQPKERINWGYWDGRADSARGKYPQWSKSWIYRGKHPLDQQYAKGYWAGWYGEPHPNTGEVPS